MNKDLVEITHHQTFESLNKKRKMAVNFGVLEN